MLFDLFSGRWNALKVTPFKTLLLTFEDPVCELMIDKIKDRNNQESDRLSFALREGKNEEKYTTESKGIDKDIRYRFPREVIEHHIDSLERVAPSRWFDRNTGETLTMEEVIMTYGDELPFDDPRLFPKPPNWLKEKLDKFQVHFIQTQRLFAMPPMSSYEGRHERKTSAATVDQYSKEMSVRIQDSLRQSAVLGASLDRTFPHRLLGAEPTKGMTEEQIRKRYVKQAKDRGRLMEAGLIDPEKLLDLPPGELDRNARRVLYLYLNDVQKKFEVFDSLLRRVELFKDIINSRFLYKTFAVNKEKGFVFEAENGKIVPLRALSSGEQHELVLAFELLFRVKEGSLILIDEPELSLHVVWQHKFLEDIGSISKLADLDFLVATHSPSIIHKQTHLMVSLGEKG